MPRFVTVSTHRQFMPNGSDFQDLSTNSNLNRSDCTSRKQFCKSKKDYEELGLNRVSHIIKCCHQRGIRAFLDVVMNVIAPEGPLFAVRKPCATSVVSAGVSKVTDYGSQAGAIRHDPISIRSKRKSTA